MGNRATNKTDWSKAKLWYMEDSTRSYKDVAKKFKVSVTAIQKYGKNENWVKARNDFQARVEEDATDALVDKKVKLIEDSFSDYKKLRGIAMRKLGYHANRDRDQQGNPTFKTLDSKELKDLTMVIDKSITGMRTAVGLPSTVTGISDPDGKSVSGGLNDVIARARKIVDDNEDRS